MARPGLRSLLPPLLQPGAAGLDDRRAGAGKGGGLGARPSRQPGAQAAGRRPGSGEGDQGRPLRRRDRQPLLLRRDEIQPPAARAEGLGGGGRADLPQPGGGGSRHPCQPLRHGDDAKRAARRGRAPADAVPGRTEGAGDLRRDELRISGQPHCTLGFRGRLLGPLPGRPTPPCSGSPNWRPKRSACSTGSASSSAGTAAG